MSTHPKTDVDDSLTAIRRQIANNKQLLKRRQDRLTDLINHIAQNQSTFTPLEAATCDSIRSRLETEQSGIVWRGEYLMAEKQRLLDVQAVKRAGQRTMQQQSR